MAVAVFDADVLIAFLGSEDANHEATAIDAEKRGHADVRLESFDKRVGKAYRDCTRGRVEAR